jgi:hypothetical protein
MQIGIGNQYPNDDKLDKSGFLRKARLHQSEYRAFELEVDFDKYGNYLLESDARTGLNFYNGFGVFENVKKRFKKYSKSVYANMLRSEHMAFNLFVPLEGKLKYAERVLNVVLNNSIKSVDKILIEYAPKPVANYLNDKTSFDAYIEYTHINNIRGIIGIEVKYTERSYKLKKGSKQELEVNNPSSIYYQITNESGIYDKNKIHKLKQDDFRQLWRNQILGESILLSKQDDFTHFTSLIIFPKSNIHVGKTNKEYRTFLIDKNKFIPLTLENFIHLAEVNKPNAEYDEWIEYLKRRYIVK